MSETKLNTALEAELEHLIEYINGIARVTEVAIAAGADLDMYNDLCAKLIPGSSEISPSE
jgi:hypothetical protein